MESIFLSQGSGFSVNLNHHLTLNSLDLVEISALSERPIYVFNELAIRENIQAYRRSLAASYPKAAHVFYASKAFLNLGMGVLLKQEETGIDVCSEGELSIALKAKIPASRIIMHGNNKSLRELKGAVEAGIHCLIVDNKDELFLLNRLCNDLKLPCSIQLRINPDVPASTHKHLDTGAKESKFGFFTDREKIPEYLRALGPTPYLRFKGIHCHIGSNILDMSNFTKAVENVTDYLCFLKKAGLKIEVLNMGGGVGIPYKAEDQPLEIDVFVQTLCRTLVEACQRKDLDLPELMVEPGRSIVGSAGCTLYTVGAIKEGAGGIFYAAINGGMSDNIRPPLYQAPHIAVIANKMNDQGPFYRYKIVGKCCETGDVLIQDIRLPEVVSGDTLVVFSTGAYCHSLANNYNKHPLPGTIFVRNGAYDWVSKEQSLEDLVRQDVLPPHLT